MSLSKTQIFLFFESGNYVKECLYLIDTHLVGELFFRFHNMILPSAQIKKYGRKVLAGYNDLATTTFPETVKMLIGEEGEGRQKSCPAPSQDFRLPEKNEDNEKIIKYLTEKREIEKKLVEEWIDRGDIYEEKKHHNVIFVGRDADGIPRYAHCRGTGEIKYRGDVAGSDKSYGFSYRGTDNQLFVFEAAIDWDTRPCLTII